MSVEVAAEPAATIKPASIDIGLALDVTGEVSHHRRVHDSCPRDNISTARNEVSSIVLENGNAGSDAQRSASGAHPGRTCALSHG